MIIVALIIGSLIIVGLCVYAIQQWRLVFKQQKQRKHEAIQVEESRAEAAAQAFDNIFVVLKAIDQGQVSLTEAAIRIMAYRLALRPDQQQWVLFGPFDGLAMATAHIPILDGWKALERTQQEQLEQERIALEQSYEVEILKLTREYLLLEKQLDDNHSFNRAEPKLVKPTAI
ncbi:MAG: DUF2489 domain-containing protein [Spongiibacteraceae bacterium]